MEKIIKTIQKEYDKNGNHNTFVAKKTNKKIFIFNAIFTDGMEVRFGSETETSIHTIGSTVDVSVIRNDTIPYVSIKKLNTFAKEAKKPLIKDNSLVASNSVQIAMDAFGKQGFRVDFKVESKDDFENKKIGRATFKRFATVIAKLTIEVQNELDLL